MKKPIAYVGDTRSRKLLAQLRSDGIGQIIIRGRLKNRRLDLWAYDNGAFEDWRAERPFDGQQFLSDLRTMRDEKLTPDFIVLPDRVASPDSLEFSMVWLRAMRAERLMNIAPLYLAVQDGMIPTRIPWGAVDGVFVGGTIPWKLASVESWTRAAHGLGLKCHYARCGTARRVSHAISIGVDSLDSCLPLWSKENMGRFMGAFRQEQFQFNTQVSA